MMKLYVQPQLVTTQPQQQLYLSLKVILMTLVGALLQLAPAQLMQQVSVDKLWSFTELAVMRHYQTT